MVWNFCCKECRSQNGATSDFTQAKILLDSNSYFPLAREIHPFLFQEFGQKNYCLFELKELEQENERSPFLKSTTPGLPKCFTSDYRQLFEEKPP